MQRENDIISAPCHRFCQRPRGVRVLEVSGLCEESGVSVSWVSPRPVPGDSNAN
jgi:hypothetical protein